MADPRPLRGKPFFEGVYEDRAPWDIEAPQPELMRLIGEFAPPGRILDVGCGTGDLAIALARMGHSVLGVDFVEAAIEVARSRLAVLPAEARQRVELRVVDALRVSDFAGEIRSVVDSGFFHLFDRAARVEYAHELGVALPVGSRYYMLGFAVSFPVPNAPLAVTPEEMAELFSEPGGWLVRASRSARFRTRGFDDVPALAFCAERTDDEP